MELTIAGNPDMHIEGTVTVDLPEYMKILPAHELKEAQEQPMNNDLVLAAGVHKSGYVVFLTVSGELRELSIDDLSGPVIKAWPVDFGQAIAVELQDSSIYEIACDWAAEIASSLLHLGSMATSEGSRISYIDAT